MVWVNAKPRIEKNMNSQVKSDLPMVSVWMITYNHEQFIAEAIESVLMQKTNFRFELVIGEDGSTDGTADIIKKYSDNYPDIIRARFNKPNIGMIPNMIKTLEECTGKYIAMLEGDDYWIDQLKLQKQIEFLEANEDYGLIHTNANILNPLNKILKRVNDSIPINYLCGNIFNALLQPSPYPMIIKTGTVVFRTNIELFEIFRIALERSWLIGDLVLWLELSSKSKVGYLSDATAVYRIDENSVSNSKVAIKNFEILKSAFEIRLYFAEREKVNSEEILKILIDQFNFFLRFARVYELKEAKSECIRIKKLLGSHLSLKQEIFYLSIFSHSLKLMTKIYEKLSIIYSKEL